MLTLADGLEHTGAQDQGPESVTKAKRQGAGDPDAFRVVAREETTWTQHRFVKA